MTNLNINKRIHNDVNQTAAGAWHATATGETLRKIRADLPRLSDALSASYFAHSAISRARSG